MTLPAFMPSTCALLMSFGEGRPGIAAVVTIRSALWMCFVTTAAILSFSSCVSSRA
jgi:hypothetical protein